MFKIYDTQSNFIKMIDRCKDCCVTKELETGFQTLSFKLPVTEENLAAIAEEYYIETADYRYVVKEVNITTNDFFTVYCNPDVEELKMTITPVYDVIETLLPNALAKVVKDTRWTISYKSSLGDKVTYAIGQSTPYEILLQIKEDFSLEYFFDTKKRVCYVYDNMGADRGVAFMNELKLKQLGRQGQSYDFATVLYPIGKDGLTIATVNNGKPYVENYNYCNKTLTKYWIQEDIEYPEELKLAAENYLEYISTPIVSYSVELSSLPEGVTLGDTIILIDKIKRIKQKQRVVKIVHYPFTPERDKVELSNQIVNFAETFIRFNTDYKKQIAYIKKNLTTMS